MVQKQGYLKKDKQAYMKDPRNILGNWKESSLSFDQNLRLKMIFRETGALHGLQGAGLLLKLGGCSTRYLKHLILDRIVRSIFI